MTSNLNSNDPFYQNGFNGTFAPGQYFLDNNQMLQLNYQPVYEEPECKKQKITENQTDPDTKRQKTTESREFGFFGAHPPQSLGSNSPPSSNESSSPNYPLNQQYPFNFTADYHNQKHFPTIIQTTVIDDLNRIDNVYIKKSKRDPIAEYDAELAESIEFELGLKKQNGPRKNSWGNLSYAELITRAIESSAEQRLTLSQIYDWIIKYVPYFKEKFDRTSSAGWKNSIRHNLSLHNRFIRVQNESSGKSSWWMINPDVSKYAINSSGQDEIISNNYKDSLEKSKTDEVRAKKTRRLPTETNFEDKAKKSKSKCTKKAKNSKKPETKVEKLDISSVDSPVSPSNFSMSNNILRTALQKPSNTPPTPTTTPSVTYRSYTGDFYQNTMSYPSNVADYTYQNNGLNKSSQYYNYQCLNNNQSYSKGYLMPQINNSNLYFNQNYQKASNVSSPVSTASTTSTASTSSYDLSNRLNKTGQQSLPMTPSSINSSIMNSTSVAAYDDFNDIFKGQTNSSTGQATSYSVYQTNQNQMAAVNNSTPIGCFYGN